MAKEENKEQKSGIAKRFLVRGNISNGNTADVISVNA